MRFRKLAAVGACALASAGAAGCGKASIIGQRVIPAAQDACDDAATLRDLIANDPTLTTETRQQIEQHADGLRDHARRAANADGIFEDMRSASIALVATDSASVAAFLKVCDRHEIEPVPVVSPSATPNESPSPSASS